MNFRKELRSSQAGFQMAPLIDIVFLLLIFFMAAAIYAQYETKIGITVPTAKSGVRETRQPGEIIINIDREGRIFISENEVGFKRLQSLLQHVATEFKNQPVIIRADAQTPHRAVIEVLDICRQVDIWNVAFASLPEDAT